MVFFSHRISLLSLFLFGLSLAGCGGRDGLAATREERIAARQCVINIGADPSSLDPSQITEVNAARAVHFLMDGLTALDTRGHPVPALADRWTSSTDGLTWRFHLRPAKWSNGEPIRAQDFVYTWTRRVLNPQFASQYVSQLFYVKGAQAFYEDPSLGADSVGVRAIDDQTLEVQLAAPTPFLLQLMAHQVTFPVCPSVDQATSDWYRHAKTYVSSGPFVLKSYQPGYLIVADKNPNYWNAGAVAMERVGLRMIEQESTERIAYENGEIDGTAAVPRQEIDQLRKLPGWRSPPLLGTYYIVINTRKPVLSDPRVRRALALAIDRRAIVEHITRAGERVALTLTPPPLYDDKLPETPLRDADYDGARRLLAEAGYPGGKGFPTLHYLYNTMEGHRLIGLAIQQTWKKELGIDLQLENQEFKIVVDRRHSGDYELSRSGWSADFADAINFLELFDSDNENNDAKFHDPQYDAMLAAIRREPDAARRTEMMRQAETYLLNQTPLIPLYFYTQPYLCAPRLKGYDLNPLGQFEPTALKWGE